MELTWQIDHVAKVGIKACGLSSANKAEDPHLLQKMDRGEFDMVFACPEALLEPRGHFFTQTLRSTEFRQRLLAIAFDECHLAYNWRDFRVAFRALGNIKRACRNVPWVCLSATLTAGAEAYVHEVCALERGARRISTTVRRDNINLTVLPMTSGAGFDQLCDLLPADFTSPNDIPKTLIFIDNVDHAILLLQAFRRRLGMLVNENIPIESRHLMDPQQLIQCYFSPLDDRAKSASLETIQNGDTRICICTEAFGMGVDIPDILRVIQWGVSSLLTAASLFQRVGRAARDPECVGIGVVYVQETILRDIAKLMDNVGSNLHDYVLAVEDGNSTAVDRLVSQLYRRCEDGVSETQEDWTPSLEKLDPGVLWFLATTGCRWRVLLKIFMDPNPLANEHKSWCCDRCAIRHGVDHSTELHGISLDMCAEIQRAKPKKKQVKPPHLIFGKYTVPTAPGEPDRDAGVCAQRSVELSAALYRWRDVIFKFGKYLPTLMPSMILSDGVILHLVANSKRITTLSRLCEELEKGKVVIETGFLTPPLVEHLFKTIAGVLNVTPFTGTPHHSDSC
jgi:hypothetical protein